MLKHYAQCSYLTHTVTSKTVKMTSSAYIVKTTGTHIISIDILYSKNMTNINQTYSVMFKYILNTHVDENN